MKPSKYIPILIIKSLSGIYLFVGITCLFWFFVDPGVTTFLAKIHVSFALLCALCRTHLEQRALSILLFVLFVSTLSIIYYQHKEIKYKDAIIESLGDTALSKTEEVVRLHETIGELIAPNTTVSDIEFVTENFGLCEWNNETKAHFLRNELYTMGDEKLVGVFCQDHKDFRITFTLKYLKKQGVEL